MYRCLSMWLFVVFLFSPGLVRADEQVVPGAGWTASRYENLWTRSPFSVATPEAGPESTEYSLWGIAQIDGVSYASLTEKKSDEHFLLSTDKPVRGLTLVSITRGDDASGTLAVLQKDGQTITVKLEITSPTPTMAANPTQNASPALDISPLARFEPSVGMPNNPNRLPGQSQVPPVVLRRPLTVHVPPNLQQQMPSPQFPASHNP